MSQRFQYVCDVHKLAKEFVEIEDDSLIGFDGVWYKMGFCPKCDNDVVKTVRDLIMEHGIKLRDSDVKPVKRASSPRAVVEEDASEVCLWCSYAAQREGALQVHIKRHGFNGFKDAFGFTCPVCNVPDLKIMGQHAPTHEAGTTAQLFQLAIKLGDPHGIVEKRIKAGR